MEIQRFLAFQDGGSSGKTKPRLNPNLSFYADYWQSIGPTRRHAISQVTDYIKTFPILVT